MKLIMQKGLGKWAVPLTRAALEALGKGGWNIKMKDVNCRNWSCKFSLEEEGATSFVQSWTELTGAGYQCKLKPRRAVPMLTPHQRRGCSGAGSGREGNRASGWAPATLHVKQGVFFLAAGAAAPC